MNHLQFLLSLAFLATSAELGSAEEAAPIEKEPAQATPVPARQGSATATKEQEAEIRQLIERLAIPPLPAKPKPAAETKPRPKQEPQADDPFGSSANKDESQGDDPFAVDESDPEYQKARERAITGRKAFYTLMSLKELAFPFLIEHLHDTRQSLDFHGHHVDRSVGKACYWIILYQLMPGSHPFGFRRNGRDLKPHVTPFYSGSPFDDAGGPKEWLHENETLSYTEKQIKCLSWLLAKEKEIGASNPESYFVNILPLEIQILKYRQQLGQDVGQLLKRSQEVLENKDAAAIPPELLPAKEEQN